MLHICASGGKLSENNIFYSDILWSSCTILRMAASSVLLWQKAAIAGIVVRKNSWIKELKICLLIYSIFILIKLFYTAKQWGRVLNKFSTLNPVWLQLVCQIGKDRFFHIKTTCFCSTHKTFFMNVCASNCVYCIFFPPLWREVVVREFRASTLPCGFIKRELYNLYIPGIKGCISNCRSRGGLWRHKPRASPGRCPHQPESQRQFEIHPILNINIYWITFILMARFKGTVEELTKYIGAFTQIEVTSIDSPYILQEG